MNLRLVAAQCLLKVVENGQSLSRALPAALENISDERDRAFLQQLCYGVLRWHLRLEALATCLLKKAPRKKDRDILMLLLVGLYQLAYMKTSEHAAVHETAGAARSLGKEWAVKLINAVLRGFQRNSESLLADLDAQAGTRFSVPQWMLKQLQADWPDDWELIAHEFNQKAPMTLRVNQRKQTRQEYQQKLKDAGIAADVAAYSMEGLHLTGAVSVDALPGFRKGEVSVQDGAAQLAQSLLCVEAGARVLDACAAPGGKTAHLLEAANKDVHLTAVEKDKARSERITETLDRLGLSAHVLVADASLPQAWWDGVPFERILLDAPCSATGVVRRHPDIKLLRRKTDIAALVQQQAVLLDRLWPLLARKGMLLYATCSVSKKENSGQIESFLQRTGNAVELPIKADWGRGCSAGRQILPGEDCMDGFYYARLTKE